MRPARFRFVLLALLLAGGLRAEPPVRVTVEPGVPAPLGETVRAVASAAIPFLIRDMGLANVEDRPLEVLLCADPDGMRTTARKRGQTITVGARTAGVSRGDILYLNAKYLLSHRTKGARPAGEVALKAALVTSHELTHALANRVSRRNLPRWFNEGLAVHESARFVALQRGDAPAAAAFEKRRLGPLDDEDPLPLDQLAFGKKAARLFYGKEHRVCYASAYAGVRALVEAHGQPVIGALLGSCGQGLPRRAKIPERRLRWYRAVRQALARDPGTLDGLRDAWLERRESATVPATEDDDLPGEEDPES